MKPSMKLRVVPVERDFYRLFRQDIQACRDGVSALMTMLNDMKDAKSHARRVGEIEREGDAITSSIFSLLNRTFITPFEREDVIALASIIDDVLDAVDEVATMLVLYGIKQPLVYLLEASTLLQQAVQALAGAIDGLQSFKGIAACADEVHRIENEADALYYNAIAELFLPGTY